MKVWSIDTSAVSLAQKGSEQLHVLLEPAGILQSGGLVAFPTETVYGLGADATSQSAVQSIFAAKGRPGDNPLIVHIASAADIARVTAPGFVPSPAMQRAMAAFWPGPLTIIVPVHESIAPAVHPELDTIGVRVPNHRVAQALIALAGCPLAAPSANRSGRPSPTTAEDVLTDFAGEDVVAGVVDAGPCDFGIESTVVAFEDQRVVIYRPGGVTKSAIEAAVGLPVVFDTHLTDGHSVPKSPGMKYRHYAPTAQVDVWWGQLDGISRGICSFIEAKKLSHRAPRFALMAPAKMQTPAQVDWRWQPERSDEPYDIALSRDLYRMLRQFDKVGATHIAIVGVHPESDIGAAVMNRLQKASEGRIHQVGSSE